MCGVMKNTLIEGSWVKSESFKVRRLRFCLGGLGFRAGLRSLS